MESTKQKNIKKEIKSLLKRKDLAKTPETRKKLNKLIKKLRKELKKQKRRKRRMRRKKKESVKPSIDNIIPLRGDPKIKKAIESSAPVQKALITAAIQDHFAPLQNRVGGNVFQPFNPQQNQNTITDFTQHKDLIKGFKEILREDRNRSAIDNVMALEERIERLPLTDLQDLFNQVIPDEEDQNILIPRQSDRRKKKPYINILKRNLDDPVVRSGLFRSSTPLKKSSSSSSTPKIKKKEESDEELEEELNEEETEEKIVQLSKGMTAKELKKAFKDITGREIKRQEVKTATVERLLKLDHNSVLKIFKNLG